MDRFEFGALVASLRDDMRWTQMELADRSGVDISAISNIERGERRTLLKDNMLVKLADGFHLTSMERQEFLFAASGVTELEMVRKESRKETVRPQGLPKRNWGTHRLHYFTRPCYRCVL